jgi:hypothetical protein
LTPLTVVRPSSDSGAFSHTPFVVMWVATTVSLTGLAISDTSSAWLMTTLNPDPTLRVHASQAATAILESGGLAYPEHRLVSAASLSFSSFLSCSKDSSYRSGEVGGLAEMFSTMTGLPNEAIIQRRLTPPNFNVAKDNGFPLRMTAVCAG